MNPRAIVLTITPIIMPIEDQKKEFNQKNISTLVLTSIVVKANSHIWKWLKQGKYSVIFAFLEIVFALESHFWKHTIDRKSNEFYYCLV